MTVKGGAPLEPVVRRLLDGEREIPPLPAEVRVRAMERARAALWYQAPSRLRGRTRSRARFAATAAIVLAFGAGALAALQGWHRPSVPVERSTAPVGAIREPRPAAVQLEPAAAMAPPAPVRPAKAKLGPRGKLDVRSDSQAYGAEIRLLQQAQEAVAEGRFETSLAPLAAHARLFPNGRLVEEREALRVRALTKLGRRAEAGRAADAFRTRFPRSVLLPRVTAMHPASD